jgi:hypothetical protein
MHTPDTSAEILTKCISEGCLFQRARHTAEKSRGHGYTLYESDQNDRIWLDVGYSLE